MKVAILVPTYNERENLITLLDYLKRVTEDIKKYQFEFLVIDDNSPDGTSDKVREYQTKNRSVKLIGGKKEGLGKALLRGMRYAKDTLSSDIIIQMDAV